MTTRTYHDPLHLGITLDSNIPAEKMVMNLIDSKPFQRLRRIRQLGPASLTFQGAESSRFTHSIGVFYIAKRALNQLIKIDNSLENYRGVLYASALLHDIGHAPMSHTGEEIFKVNHESWSANLIQNDPTIFSILEAFNLGTANDVGDLIKGEFKQRKLIKDLVSSQLDCDRLDYLLRDSYVTGTRYGQLDLERILSALTLGPDGEIAINPKGMMAVEHYLVVRNLMYRSVYNHKVNEVCNWMLEKIFNTARNLGVNKVWSDNCLKKWIWEPNNIDIDTFLSNDDVRTYYHLLKWREEGPKSLSELCGRFLDRNLLKATSIDHLSNEGKLEALACARKLIEKIHKDADLYCGIRHQRIDSYLPYKGGLRLWDGENLQALEKVSPLVRGLINPSQSTLLIYANEISEELKVEIHNIAMQNLKK